MRRDAEILARWDGQSLKAVGWADRDAIQALPAGTMFSLKVWEAGSQAARAFVSVFIDIAADNYHEQITAEVLKVAIKAEFGWFLGERKDTDGSEVHTYKSIGKMTRDELTRFTDQAKLFVQTELGMDADAIATEAMERIRPKGARS